MYAFSDSMKSESEICNPASIVDFVNIDEINLFVL